MVCGREAEHPSPKGNMMQLLAIHLLQCKISGAFDIGKPGACFVQEVFGKCRGTILPPCCPVLAFYAAHFRKLVEIEIFQFESQRRPK